MIVTGVNHLENNQTKYNIMDTAADTPYFASVKLSETPDEPEKTFNSIVHSDRLKDLGSFCYMLVNVFRQKERVSDVVLFPCDSNLRIKADAPISDTMILDRRDIFVTAKAYHTAYQNENPDAPPRPFDTEAYDECMKAFEEIDKE